MSATDEDDLFTGRITPGFVNLAVGAPGPETLKKSAELFESAAKHRLAKVSAGDVSLFQYGLPCGNREYLRLLANFLSDEYGDQVSPENLVLTCGATSGLHLASSTLLQPADRNVVFVECPTYFIATDILHKDLNFRIVPVPMQSDGVDVSALEISVEKEFRKRSSPEKLNSGRFWSMFYTIPTYHNPTGTLMSSEKCKKVVEIARKFDLLVFCDDVYNMLYYETDSSPKRLLAYDDRSDQNYDGGRVVSNGTFSKILAPGIRVGWIEAGNRIRNQIHDCGVLASGGSINNVMSGFISSALEIGAETDHVKYLRQLYRDRIRSVRSIFDENLPKNFECRIPGGGYFLWLTGPQDFDASNFSKFCKEQFGVFVLPGATCCPCTPGEGSNPCQSSFRLSIAYYEEPSLVAGAEKICQALKSFLEK